MKNQKKEKNINIIARILRGNILRSLVSRFALWIETLTASKGGFAGNCVTLTAWCVVLFTDFVLKCDCSFLDKFFVTGRFQVRFVLNKSEIVL
jgi:hypothetical protein